MQDFAVPPLGSDGGHLAHDAVCRWAGIPSSVAFRILLVHRRRDERGSGITEALAPGRRGPPLEVDPKEADGKLRWITARRSRLETILQIAHVTLYMLQLKALHSRLMASSGTLRNAAAVVVNHGLVDAFGHVSVRDGETCIITPAAPLHDSARGEVSPVRIPLGARLLPERAPKEAWLHLAVYAARPDVSGICRAQPTTVAAATAAGLTIHPLSGQGSLVGQAAIFPDSRLVRDPSRAAAVAATLGSRHAIVMRGNGALTVAPSIDQAVVRMVLLEASSQLNLAAAIARPDPLPLDEQAAWQAAGPELMGRLWDHFVHQL